MAKPQKATDQPAYNSLLTSLILPTSSIPRVLQGTGSDKDEDAFTDQLLSDLPSPFPSPAGCFLGPCIMEHTSVFHQFPSLECKCHKGRIESVLFIFAFLVPRTVTLDA